MARFAELINRGALAILLAGSVLVSAGCGCGGGSAGPPAPDYDRDYYPHGSYPPGLHPGYPYEPYYPDKVITRARFSGTHEGQFMGIPPTGKRFDIAVIDIIEFRDGKGVAHWGVMDMAGMMQQLGIGGPPA